MKSIRRKKRIVALTSFIKSICLLLILSAALSCCGKKALPADSDIPVIDGQSPIMTESLPGGSSSESETSSTTENQSSEVADSSNISSGKGSGESSGSTPTDTSYKPLNYTYMKACWISQFDLEPVFKADGKMRSSAEFTTLVGKMFDNLVSYGFNTVMIQVHPYGDSFYKSSLNPWSNFVTGTFGAAPEYDPFEIMLKEAHARQLSVQAWINPMRGMTDAQLQSIGEQYKVKQWYGSENGLYIVQSGDRWYFNPAYAPVRKLITDTAHEILSSYHVDGLHIDDYFYPNTDPSFDSRAYYGYCSAGGKATLEQFRFNNINSLVSELYRTVKSVDSRLIFGVSPEGYIKNDYEKHYADVKTWCSNTGYIDYICPQLYYGMQHELLPFGAVSNEWASLITVDGIRLIAGMSLGKAISGVDKYAGESGMYEWRDNKDVLKKCVTHLSQIQKCSGVSLFCYQYLFDPVTGSKNTQTTEEVNNLLTVLK